MARITVEDCLEKIDSQYDLVLLAKERTSQLNAGNKPVVEENSDFEIVTSFSDCSYANLDIIKSGLLFLEIPIA